MIFFLFLSALLYSTNATSVITLYGDVYKDVEFFTKTFPWIIDNIGGDLVVQYHLIGSGRYSVPQMCALEDLTQNTFLQAQYLKCEAEGKPGGYCLCEAGIDPTKYKQCVASAGYLAGAASTRYSVLGINFTPVVELDSNNIVYGVEDVLLLKKVCTIFGDNLPRGCVDYTNQTEGFPGKKSVAQFDRACDKEFLISNDVNETPGSPRDIFTTTSTPRPWPTTPPWHTTTTPTLCNTTPDYWFTTPPPWHTTTTAAPTLCNTTPDYSTTSTPWPTTPNWHTTTTPTLCNTTPDYSTTSTPWPTTPNWHTTTTPTLCNTTPDYSTSTPWPTTPNWHTTTTPTLCNTTPDYSTTSTPWPTTPNWHTTTTPTLCNTTPDYSTTSAPWPTTPPWHTTTTPTLCNTTPDYYTTSTPWPTTPPRPTTSPWPTTRPWLTTTPEWWSTTRSTPSPTVISTPEWLTTTAFPWWNKFVAKFEPIQKMENTENTTIKAVLRAASEIE